MQNKEAKDQLAVAGQLVRSIPPLQGPPGPPVMAHPLGLGLGIGPVMAHPSRLGLGLGLGLGLVLGLGPVMAHRLVPPSAIALRPALRALSALSS